MNQWGKIFYLIEETRVLISKTLRLKNGCINSTITLGLGIWCFYLLHYTRSGLFIEFHMYILRTSIRWSGFRADKLILFLASGGDKGLWENLFGWDCSCDFEICKSAADMEKYLDTRLRIRELVRSAIVSKILFLYFDIY